jgi:hypothetical protein
MRLIGNPRTWEHDSLFAADFNLNLKITRFSNFPAQQHHS